MNCRIHCELHSLVHFISDRKEYPNQKLIFEKLAGERAGAQTERQWHELRHVSGTGAHKGMV